MKIEYTINIFPLLVVVHVILGSYPRMLLCVSKMKVFIKIYKTIYYSNSILTRTNLLYMYVRRPHTYYVHEK